MRGRQGLYHDALNVKRSAVEIVLHETIGGGFSPPAVAKLHRHARSAASVLRVSPANSVETVSVAYTVRFCATFLYTPKRIEVTHLCHVL